ncbi:MAG: DUF3127 domain-containing protein [Bacteroidales bacterium]|nr:DUF3127 domain-containing protein [Bacteroidales bacterium]
MELAGKVIAILEARSGVSKTTGNPWKMQDYVIETHEQFPRRMVFNVFGEDKINAFNIQMGEELNVSFDINAREFQGRWFNDIRAWRIDRVQPDAAGQAPAPTAVPAAEPVPPSFAATDTADDLPF